MTRVLHRPKRDEDVLLAACATSRPAPLATTLPPLPLGAPARSHAAMAELHAAEHTSAAADHHRYDPDRLLPRHAMVRRVAPARVLLDDIDAVTADVAAMLQARPELRHDHALLMALARVVAMLKGSVA